MRCEKCGKYIVDSFESTCPYCSADLTGTAAYQKIVARKKVNTADKAAIKASKKAVKKASKLYTPLIAPGVFFGFGVVAFVLTFILAYHDIPEFIRKIPGEDFLGIVFLVDCLTVLFGWICLVISEKIFIRNLLKKTKDMKFYDSDWMRGFQKYDKVGYYVLKGILHRILQVETTIIDGKKEYYLQKNQQISDEELQQYCKKNPNVKRIIHFFNDEKKSLFEVIRNVLPDHVATSEDYKKFQSELKKIDAIRQICFAAVVTLVMYFCCTKLIMGIHHGKAVELLIEHMIFIDPFILFGAYKLFSANSDKYLKKIKEYAICIFCYTNSTYS